MLFHRFGTISHILASTELNLCFNKKSEDLSSDALIDKVRNQSLTKNQKFNFNLKFQACCGDR